MNDTAHHPHRDNRPRHTGEAIPHASHAPDRSRNHWHTHWPSLLLVVLALTLPEYAGAANGLPAITIGTSPDGSETYTLTIQVLVLMTLLTVLPALVLSMTSFTRIIIVLAILRQALGTAQSPPNQVLIGLSLFLTLFVMGPVIERSYQQGVKPYLDQQLSAQEALARGMLPVRDFMLGQTRHNDLATFARIGGGLQFNGPEDVPMRMLVPAFVTSELKTAFQIGFLVFIPFLVIDLVVASVLMSMGMMMLSPMLISLPFKIMLFVLVDGWALLVETLAASFFT